MDISALLCDYDLTKIDSRYRLVIIAAQRARQLMQGSTPQVNSKFVKAAPIALEEVLQGKIEFLVGKEAKAALKEANQARAAEARARSRPAGLFTAVDKGEIQKDLAQFIDDRPKVEPPSANGEA
ncbi:MAG TPA: DNA-directed RNA polymerase subunit omega [Nitrospiria bacterium]